MFSYGKKTATVFLVLYIFLTAIILALSILPSEYSSKMSYSFYDMLSHLRFGEDKMSENKTDVDITKITIETAQTDYYVKTRVQVLVKAVEPEDHTEGYSIKTDDAAVGKLDKDGVILLISEGVVNVWAESDKGLRSNVITLTVKERETESELDPDNIEIVVPQELAIGQAFCPYFTYEGEQSSVDAVFSCEGDVLRQNGKYFVTEKQGVATILLSINDVVVKTTQITVTSDVAPAPEIIDFKLNGVTVGDDLTLIYHSVYEPEYTFKDDNACPLIYFSAEKGYLNYWYSQDRSDSKIRVVGNGEVELKIMSPVSDEPLKTINVKTLPPKANVLGLKQTGIVYVDHYFPITLKVADADSLIGINCEITSEEDLPFEQPDQKSVFFKSEGKYTLTYTSEYYPDFKSVYTVVVEDMNKAISVRKSLGHAALFAALGVFALLAFWYFAKKLPLKILFVSLAGVLTAIVSEILQLPVFTSGRGAAVEDVFIDLSGYAVGIALTFAIAATIYFIRLKKKRSASSNTVE